MKYLFVVLGMLVVSVAYSKVSIKETRAIYKLICKKNNIKCPQLKVFNTKEVNAATSTSHIEVYTGMLEVTDKDELALVLGHEVAHYVHKDAAYVHLFPKLIEERADLNGAVYMQNAGYNRCAGAEVFKIFYKLGGDGGRPGDDHPRNSVRYLMVRQGCK